MTNSCSDTSVNSMGPEDDDTIELELSESAMQLLSQAAAVPLEAPCPATKSPAANAPETPTAARKEAPRGSAASTRPPRFGLFFAVATVASALLIAVVYLAAAHVRRPDPVVPRVVAAPAAPVSVTPPPPSPSTDATPVRFVNPFDRKEVFEFPPGTSEADAHQAVAELLSQRARERQSLLTKVPRRAGKTAERISPGTPSGLAPRG